MALLIGYDGAGWTYNDAPGLQNNTGHDIWFSITAAATGTATTAYLYMTSWQTANNVSVALYTSGGVKIAESATIPSSAGTGLKSASISASVTQGTSYILVMMTDGYVDVRGQSGGPTYANYSQAIGTPGSAPASFTPGGVNGANNIPFIIYLDGLTGGSAGRNLLMGVG